MWHWGKTNTASNLTSPTSAAAAALSFFDDDDSDDEGVIDIDVNVFVNSSDTCITDITLHSEVCSVCTA